MVLKVTHSTWYYKKFYLDIWGSVLTTTYLIPKKPRLKSLRKFVDDEYKKVQWRLGKRALYTLHFANKFKNYLIKKYFELRDKRIKKSSKQNTKLIWRIRSRKLTSILSMFSKMWIVKKKKKKKWKPRYIYTLDIIKKLKKRRKMKKRFASLRLTKIFYITLTYRQFRQLAKIMRRKIGAFENNYLLALECRLMSYLYRTSLLTNPFYCMKFIREGNVLVNMRYENHYNYRLSIYTLVTFSSIGKRILFKTILPRLRRKRTYFNVPRFIFLSYFFFYSYMIKPPVAKDLVFPISIDFYRATGYAF